MDAYHLRVEYLEMNVGRFQWCITQACSPKGVARRSNLTNFSVDVNRGHMAGYASC